MRLHYLDISVFAAYVLVVMAVGLFASRRAGGSKRDYFLAGDKLSWWMIGGSIIAANISSHHFVGIMGVAYTRGFVALTIAWPAIFTGFLALLWIFLPFYLRNGFYTVPEYLERRYGGAARATYGALIFMTYVFVEIAAVLYLGSLVLHSLLGIPYWWSIIVLAFLTGIYTITGGLRAVVWTEMLQLVVLTFGGAVLSILTIQEVGGLSAVMATSQDWHLILPATDLDFPWTQYLGGIICISVFYNATNQFIVQRTLAAKDEWHARMGVVFVHYLQFVMPFIYIAPGLVAPLLFPDLAKGDLVFPTLVKNILPAGLVGLVMAGLMAAVMSHISGAINSCTTIATVDFYLPYINKNATDRQAVAFGRWVGVLIVVLGVMWAGTLLSHSDKPVFIYLLNAYGYFTPGIATMFLLGILWKRTTHAGALSAGLLTIPLSLTLEKLAPHLGPRVGPLVAPFMNRTGIVFWLCVLVCIVVSLLTKPKPDEELEGLIWNRESLKLPKELRVKMRGLRNPTFWWAIIMAITIYAYIRYW
ncbi:MAG: sodium:solute symporter family transporter [Pirellulaceae bacterium]